MGRLRGVKTVSVIVSAGCVSVAGKRSTDFIIGLTNVDPRASPPALRNYTLCGQYPGAVPASATVSMHCPDNLPPFRYVIVQFPLVNDFMTLCELQVFTLGTAKHFDLLHLIFGDASL